MAGSRRRGGRISGPSLKTLAPDTFGRYGFGIRSVALIIALPLAT
jgi:hypothetical protein